jgi:23S rRNA pseudouridine2605 synthase
MHPSKKISKTYLVKVKDIIEEKNIEKLQRGIRLEDGKTLPAKVRKVRELEKNSWIEITLFEGKKRQIRRMLEYIGHPVIVLRRISVNGLKLKDLKEGEIRHLTPDELKLIRRKTSLYDS